MLYIKDSIPHRLLNDYSGVYMGIEYLTVEVSVKSYKWNLIYIYRPPSVNVKVFCDFVSGLCETFVNDIITYSCHPRHDGQSNDSCPAHILPAYAHRILGTQRWYTAPRRMYPFGSHMSRNDQCAYHVPAPASLGERNELNEF